jgi:hypothetical protein
MKYIKEYKQQFDLDFAMAKIKEEYPEIKVMEMYDEEMLEWIDPDWEDDYESEYDWYMDHNNGEAQDVVITHIINWYKSKYEVDLNTEEYSDLFGKIKEEYNLF